jgi:SAM-dependent methyltransferase
MSDTTDRAELERWNGRYAAKDYVFGTRPNAFLAAQAHRLKPGMTALSVADGEGRNSVWLAAQGLKVTAFDFSPVGVAKAKAFAAREGVEIDHRIADINAWDWQPEAFDVVAGIFFQFTPPVLRARVFAGIAKTLKPGGLVLLQGYGPGQLAYGTGGPKQLENLYTEELLRESFASLEILHLAAYDAEVDEGGGHSGMSALIDLVARK